MARNTKRIAAESEGIFELNTRCAPNTRLQATGLRAARPAPEPPRWAARQGVLSWLPTLGSGLPKKMFITVGDAQIFSIAFGSPTAPAILGIGGWIGSWELWALPFAKLCANWYTIAFDHRGSGATIAPIASITLDQLAADVFAVMDAHHLERCYLAAESAGAATAFIAALKNPQRIAGLIIVDGYYFGNTPNASDPFLAGLKSNYAATLDAFVEACVPEQDCGPIKHWGRQILDRAEPEAAIALYCATNPIDLRGNLGQIEQPTLILHGEIDRLVPVESAHWLAKTLPKAKLSVLPGAGHVPTMTKPSEVAREITHFLGSE